MQHSTTQLPTFRPSWLAPQIILQANVSIHLTKQSSFVCGICITALAADELSAEDLVSITNMRQEQL